MKKIGKYVLGVDIGTGSAKTILSGFPGQAASIFTVSYSTRHPQPGYAELDPEEVAKAVFHCIQQVVDTQYTAPAVISFSSAMHSLMAVDNLGNPLTPLMLWSDHRSKNEAADIKESVAGSEIYQRTGTPIHAMSPMSKIKWLQNHQPQTFQKAHKFIGIKEYIFHKLFKQFVVDYNIASAMGMFDFRELTWYNQALAAAGISADQLSLPVNPATAFTQADSILVADMGIHNDTVFVIGGSDGCMAQIGSGATKEHTATLTIGTSGAIRMVSNTPKVSANGELFTYVLTDNKYLIGGAINNGGGAINWFRETFYPASSKSELSTQIDAAFAIQPGAGGLLCLPYFAGERAPIWNSDARGVFLGIGVEHTVAHFNRALVEGISYSLYNVGEALHQTTGRIDNVLVSGGFTASQDWIQLLSDVFQLPMVLQAELDSSAIGASLLAWQHLGEVDAWHYEAHDFLAEYRPTQQPAYAKQYALFKEAYQQLKGIFPKLQPH
ncbi:gluconate kinase (FGGY family) [Chitinophaga skermanii]|uniref:Gluconate kinase (FGGY family) n=1 Tax=Chitinophaga skermanii TaxID=331697 RepID=A0A327QA94_9BACT|nr:gluconokinase [Chitinophaga skermanii]RAI98726.1 gluconate kinase (FGGY family) [Chitinophaga skermanii]